MIYDLVSSLLDGADIRDVLPGIVFTIIVVLFSLSLHEASHGFMASKLGDRTAKNLGRLTLDPSKHLDPVGTVCMLLFGFGWAKPVPVNSRNFKKPRRDMALTAFAGPVSNLILSFVMLLAWRIVLVFSDVAMYFAITGFNSSVLEGAGTGTVIVCLLSQLLYYFHIMNLYLAVFNLIPVPPLDGSRILFLFLPDRLYFGLMKYEKYIMIAVFLLLATGALSSPLSWLCGKISDGMYMLISLIPGL